MGFLCVGECKKFLCANGKCLINGKPCNGVDDCGDNSDEMCCKSESDDISPLPVFHNPVCCSLHVAVSKKKKNDCHEMHYIFIYILFNRSEYVKIDQQLSEPLTINKGVPQGSVLASTLFSI